MQHEARRYDALDNLRATLMWLGIVLHASANHVLGMPPLPFVDRATSVYANLTLVVIHSFRMPVFFMLAGFFVAMLNERRGVGGMLSNRLRRIGLPLVLLGPAVFAAVGVVALVYVHVVATGTLGIDVALLPADPVRPRISTMHMWFIYYLLLYSLLTAVACKLVALLSDGARQVVPQWGAGLGSTWLGLGGLLIPLTALSDLYRDGLVRNSGTLVPDGGAFAYYGIFFAFGLFLYRHREPLLSLYARKCLQFAVAGLFLMACFIALLLSTEGDFKHFSIARDVHGVSALRIAQAALYSGVGLLWSLASIGFFVRYLSRRHRLLQYLSESAYWVYLVHMIGTIGFGALLYRAPWGVGAKMAVNVAATSLACLASYHLLVRRTWLGLLLNGRRHQGKAPMASPSGEGPQAQVTAPQNM